ncbi:MAG: hypothetical protein C0429_12820 [Sphingopyxis sp.]|nr:hypothetical protein [Sphingopyxis sp.]
MLPPKWLSVIRVRWLYKRTWFTVASIYAPAQPFWHERHGCVYAGCVARRVVCPVKIFTAIKAGLAAIALDAITFVSLVVAVTEGFINRFFGFPARPCQRL